MESSLLAEWCCGSSIFKCSPISSSAHTKRSLTALPQANAEDHHHRCTTTTTTTKAATLLPPKSHTTLHDQTFPLKSQQWVHFIGIGGYGLSALAFYALQKGWHVTGSDISWSKKLEGLQSAGATVYVGHRISQLWGQDGKQLPDHVVLSSAIPCNNVELSMALELGLKIHKRGSWLAQTTCDHDLIAVSGSHGKSTTTAMLSMVLKDMDTNISAVVGADVPQFPGGGSVMCGSGSTFILEADEYDGCFLSLTPQIALITNIDWEHVDMFPDEAAVIDLFRQFCRRLKPGGTLIFCGDSESARCIASDLMLQAKTPEDEGELVFSSHQVVSYGLGENNVWRAVMIEPNSYGGSDYLATCNREVMTRVQIQLPGLHNVLNSLAVIATAVNLISQNPKNEVGLSVNVQKEASEAASASLRCFRGVRRRLEFVGMMKHCLIYDDYAHHPTEVEATLEAARQLFSKQPVWLVFQPHEYIRVSKLLKQFAAALAGADRVIVTEIYAARGKNSWGISGQDIVNEISRTSAVYIPGLDGVCAHLLAELADFGSSAIEDRVVIITMGAGDITNLGLMLLQKLSRV
ncbi:hypothetical protein GOP47_0013139 [Adiantum capillus-veneris]|uniref:UDP-N-acetylmuramate--L-alanine ligase n=1 Tax=Adiantum capillus-veneris TaxID=13818 RepID=A0A9D4UMY6_ADICA|nr:hypothetical protein GOP47_0013139 [Adiantum capillus-veneris]